jgi:hypothetical protein
MSVTMLQAPAAAERKRTPAVLGTAGAVAVIVASAALVHAAAAVPPAAIAAWGGAFALALTVAVAVRRAGWFHPLAFPLAVIALMSFGAPVWVYLTGQCGGLLCATGSQAAALSPLAVTVSARTCAALVLVLAGYLAAAAPVLALAPRAGAAAPGAPVFRHRAMQSAGLLLTGFAALGEAASAALADGTSYGDGSVQYGIGAVLATAAAVALLTGLIATTLAAAGTSRRLRDVLPGPAPALLALYALAAAAGGHRGVLIAPAVYLAWVYSTQVRVISVRWAAVIAALALAGAAVIAGYRAGDGLVPRSAAAIAASDASDVSYPAWLTQQTAQRVPEPSPYARGSTYLAAAEAQLPGPLARRTGALSRTATAAFRNLIGFSNPDMGFAESYPSEAYLNFGLAGCLGAGLFLGALMGWAWRRCRVPAARPRDLLYPVLIAGLAVGFRSDAVTQVKDVLYPMLIMPAVMWHCRPGRAPGRASSHLVGGQLDAAGIGVDGEGG